MDCIFCKIAQKKIPAAIVHETDRIIVVKDIHPQAPTHLLIMPKEHYSTIVDCNDRELLGEVLEAATDVARMLGLDQRGFRTIINTNREGGQTVFHMHMHFLGGKPLTEKMV